MLRLRSPSAPPGKTIRIQVFLHLANQAERASFLATTMDASAKLKGTKSLDLPIKRGAQVEIAFSANGLTVDDPVQSVVWRGEPAYCQFLATIPAGTSGQSFFPVIRVSVDGKLVGPIKFRLTTHTATTPCYINQWQNGKLLQVQPLAHGVTLAVPTAGLG